MANSPFLFNAVVWPLLLLLAWVVGECWAFW